MNADGQFKNSYLILRMLALPCAGILFFNGIAIPQASWNFIHPVPTGNRLNSISFFESKTGYSAGSTGTVIKTTDGGISWIRENSGVSTEINRIICLSKYSAIAVGEKGVILTKSSTEDFWIRRRCPVPYNLHDVNFISDKTGYAAGLGGTVLKTTNGGTHWIKLNTGISASLFCIDFADVNTGVSGGFNVLIKTTNGGLNWIQQNVTINPPSQITDVKMFGCDTIIVLCSTPYGEFHKSTDGGLNWTVHSLNLPLLFEGTVDLVRSFSFKNSQTGYIVTDLGTILKTENGGISWISDSSFRPAYEKTGIFREVYLFDSNNIYIAGGGGTVLKKSDNGTNWEILSGNHEDMRSVFFQNESTGYSVGEKGSILKSTNSGSDWSALKFKSDEILNHITFISDNTGFISGNKGVILKSTDSGNKWVNLNSGTTEDLRHAAFINTSTGYICGGKNEALILKSTNAGESWQQIYSNPEILRLNSIEFINVNTGFACGKFGYLLSTSDGGSNWMTNLISPEELLSLSFFDEQHGLIAGEDGFILRTLDGGNTWNYTESGYYNTLFRIKFLTSDFALSAGREGTIIYSTDKGVTWHKAIKITSNALYDISVTGFSSDKIITFVSGESGTILKSEKKNPMMHNLFTKEISAKIFNIPNPFTASVRFQYEINERSKVLLKIYDLKGREIQTLVNLDQNAGKHNAYFDLRKKTGGLILSSGIYFYAFYVNGKLSASGKMLHLK